MTHVEIANQYIDDVLSGKLLSCKWVKLACERQRDDLARDDLGYVFDEVKAARVCKFIENLTHIKGKWAGKPIKLEPWQVFILTTVFGWVDSEGNRRFKIVYIEVPRKNAKALALDTLIPTPHGMVEIGNLRVGDFVIGSDGKPTEVIAESEIFTDHDCYEIEFSTGEKVVADAGHLWVTDSRSDRDRLKGRRGKTKGDKPSAKTTEELFKTQRIRGENNHRLPILSFEGAERVFDINPYVLGCWLGDGSSADNRFTNAYFDKEIVEYIRLSGETAEEKSSSNEGSGLYSLGKKTKYKESLRKRLRLRGLLDSKHIPEDYFLASKAQRLELLQGLMDTDGTISKAGQCVFSNTNRRLADDVKRLLESLGFKATVVCKDAFLYGKNCGKSYKVQFWAYEDQPVFKLKRKLGRQKIKPVNNTRASRRFIVSVRKVDSVAVKCISVAAEDKIFLCTSSYIPTHNSTLSSGVALYCLAADGEGGAEVYSAATTRDQARIVFHDAQQMAKRNEALKEYYGLSVTAHSIARESDASYFKALSRDQGGNLDGLNVHAAIIDELHAHKTRDVVDVIETATGAREQPLQWEITTAGFNRSGICYEHRAYGIKTLEKTAVDEEFFSIIFTIDDDDDWTQPESWQKANPNYGVSVSPQDLERKCRKAQQMAAAQNNFLTKHLDKWVNADTAWMDMRAWEACGDDTLELSDFYGERCIIAMDLATKIDIASKVYIFEKNDNVYVFGRHYLPQSAIENSGNSQYSGWDIEGRLTTTAGDVLDFETLERELEEDKELFDVREVVYDPFQATQFAQRMQDRGFNMVEMGATVKNFSEPMKELEALVISGKLRHDDCPVMTWMISNVVCHVDAKENIYPRKEFPQNKIDGVVATIMGLARLMLASEVKAPSIWETMEVL